MKWWSCVLLCVGCGGATSPGDWRNEGDGGGGQDTPPVTTDAADVADGEDAGVVPVVQADGPVQDATTLAECNPVQPFVADLTHTACLNGETCGFMFPAQRSTVCTGPSGTGTQGSPCGGTTDCAPGYDCTQVGPDLSCARFCRVGGMFDDCGMTLTCTSFLTLAFDGSQEIGVCEP